MGVKDEIHMLGHIIPKFHADIDARARDLSDRGMKLEPELQKTEPLKGKCQSFKRYILLLSLNIDDYVNLMYITSSLLMYLAD